MVRVREARGGLVGIEISGCWCVDIVVSVIIAMYEDAMTKVLKVEW
jgi:hypothetical protein